METTVEDNKTFTTEQITEIYNKLQNGEKIDNHEKFYFQNLIYTKRNDITIELNKKEKLEIDKCLYGVDEDNDPFYNNNQNFLEKGIIYFAEKYCLNDVFEMDKHIIYNILDHIDNHRFSIIADHFYNQDNIITAICIFYLYNLTFFNQNVAISTRTKEESLEISNVFKEYYFNLPIWLKPGVKTFNMNDIKFKDDSSLKLIPFSSNAFIGETFNSIFILDFGEYNNEKLKDNYRNIFPAVTALKNSSLIISSNIKKQTNHLFNELCEKSILDKNDIDKNAFELLRI